MTASVVPPRLEWSDVDLRQLSPLVIELSERLVKTLSSRHGIHTPPRWYVVDGGYENDGDCMVELVWCDDAVIPVPDEDMGKCSYCCFYTDGVATCTKFLGPPTGLLSFDQKIDMTQSKEKVNNDIEVLADKLVLLFRRQNDPITSSRATMGGEE
jgi:hypothetical protein